MQAVSGAGYPAYPPWTFSATSFPTLAAKKRRCGGDGPSSCWASSKAIGYGRSPLALAPVAIALARRGRPHGERQRQARQTGHARRDSGCLGGVFVPRGQGLPTAPISPIEWAPQDDRPASPRLDRHRGNGMAVTVGRLRPCGVLDWKFTALSQQHHFAGAAGAAILNR